MTASREDRSLGDLFGALTAQLAILVHKEVELARTEITANAVQTGKDASLIGVGGVVAYGGFLVLLFAAVAMLVQLGLDAWLAALVVGAIAVAVGGLLVLEGRSRMAKASLAPTRTIETLKDDAAWAKDRTR
jgi:hypothetical protein